MIFSSNQIKIYKQIANIEYDTSANIEYDTSNNHNRYITNWVF